MGSPRERARGGLRGLASQPRRLIAACGFLGLCIGVLVVLPWATGGGYLLLLDWVSGPHQTLTPGVYGLSGSALDAVPFRIGTQALRRLFGPAAVAWLLILAYFPLAAAGIATAAGGSIWRRAPAALLMVCNPFVVDRIRAGHVSFLLGLAILPWLANSALAARHRRSRIAVRPAFWYALAISLNPHAAWLGGVLLLVVALAPRPSWRDLLRTAQIVVAAGAVYTYAIVLWLTGTRTLNVTDADLQAYATQSGPGGLFLTVASLHGFWRPFPAVRDHLGPILGIALLAGVLVVIGRGLVWITRVDRDRGWFAVWVILIGLGLGAGIAGPLGPAYQLAFDHLPLFEAMREQQKWLALAVIGYSIGFGAGVEWAQRLLVRTHPAWARWIPLAVAALPLAVAPTLVWGLGGDIRTSQYPQSWAQADQAMGSGSELAMFLPWHGYQSFAFTEGRTVATPANAYFRRAMLVSDAVELAVLRTDSTSRRTAYVDRLVADGGGDAFGRMLAPLGVRYVVVASWAGATDTYTWVASQPGLERILHTSDLDLYRVIPEGVGRVETGRTATFEQALESAQLDAASTTAQLAPGEPAVRGGPSGQSGGIWRRSPTSWQVAPGAAGWVVIPEEYAPGWRTPDGVAGRPTVAGTIALNLSAGAQQVSYQPWRYLRPAILFSLLALLVLVIGGIAEHREAFAGIARRYRARRPRQDAFTSDG